jgi:1-acyl-sn-glycerol-3-phosphate acyltransferase
MYWSTACRGKFICVSSILSRFLNWYKSPCSFSMKKKNQGKHILIDREDRRSQLRTFKEGVGWLKNGMPLMAFPEGKRSDDGRLDDFKGGVFSMAVKAGVPIVPISISNTHAVMPSNSLFPVQRGSGKLHLHIHDPISAEGVKEDELAAMVREALLSKMPLDQHPLPKANDDNMDATGEVEKELQSA